MKTRFATPEERDLRFVRNSGFRSDDFGREVRIADSIGDAAVIVAMLIAVLVMVGI